jgi:hypothetical protein
VGLDQHINALRSARCVVRCDEAAEASQQRLGARGHEARRHCDSHQRPALTLEGLLLLGHGVYECARVGHVALRGVAVVGRRMAVHAHFACEAALAQTHLNMHTPARRRPTSAYITGFKKSFSIVLK